MIWIYKQYFAEELAKHIDLPLEDILAMIEIPPENIPGDFAFPCFRLSKLLKKSPIQIAEDLEKNLQSEYFSWFQNLSGYLNAHINKSDFIKDSFKLQTSSLKPQAKSKILIEYMSANPNKPLHIWQARNICVGDSMRRIYTYLWYDVTSCDYGDDSGVNIGYNIVGHLFYNIPVETDKKFDHYCGEVYSEMRKKEEDPIFMKQLSETLLKIEEDTDPEIKTLHQKYTQDCTLQQMVSCRRMGAYFDLVARETNILHLNFFSEAIEILKQKWFVKFMDDGDAKGCRVLDLSSLPEYAKEEKQYQIMVKSDGLATYIAKDIAFAMRKLGYISKDFGYDIFQKDPRWETVYTTNSSAKNNTDHIFWNYNSTITVIDYRQIPPQQIVRSALTLLGHDETQKQYIPLGYGIVYLTPETLIKLNYLLSDEEKKEKKLPFASRKWRTVSIDEMLDMLHTKAYEETKQRNPDKDENRLNEVAEAMAISALRFFLIRWDISKDIIFDLDEALDMQGETWAYVLYTGARIQSIIDAVGDVDEEKVEYSLLKEDIEFSLIKKITTLDETIQRAKEDLAPHYIARYCFELAQLVNSYYAHTKIVVDDEATKIARVFLLKKVRGILESAMQLIWMKFLKRM